MISAENALKRAYEAKLEELCPGVLEDLDKMITDLSSMGHTSCNFSRGAEGTDYETMHKIMKYLEHYHKYTVVINNIRNAVWLSIRWNKHDHR